MKKLLAIMSLISMASSLYGFINPFTVTFNNATKEDYVVTAVFACNRSSAITVKAGDSGSFSSESCCITSFKADGVYHYASAQLQLCTDTIYTINYINPIDPSVGIMMTLSSSNSRQMNQERYSPSVRYGDRVLPARARQ